LEAEPKPRRKVHWCFRSSARIGHNPRMTKLHDFQAALTRVIKLAGGPGVELATLRDAAKFVGAMRPWRRARPHWNYTVALLLKAAETRKFTDIEAATAQMERALRVEGWL
jgi:hypothetical protein